MTKKFVKVTMLTTIFSDEAEQKIQPRLSEVNKKDQHNLTVEQYEDMGIPIPEDSTHHQDLVEGESENNLDIIPSVTFFDVEEFLMVAEHLDFGSTIYLKTGHSLDVLETPRQVINRINKLNK